MTFTSLLIQTCDIERYTSTTRDDYGNPVKTWAVLHDDIACRLVSNRGKEITIDLQVVVSDWKLFIGDLDVTEHDRVVLDGNYYDIKLVIPRQDSDGGHHKELLLELVA